MKVTRRPATDSDRDFARAAHHDGYRDVVVRQFGVWDESFQDSTFEEEWSSAEFEILLCNGEPCGLVSVEDFADYVHIREFIVIPEYQGRGIGSSFLKDVLEHARARQVPVKLGVLHKNRALDLYRRFGFREFDRTETHLMMEWKGQKICRPAAHGRGLRQMNRERNRNNAQYTFGTSSAAAARLEDIACFFNPLAADFIRPFITEPRDKAVDLGCGPGFTTNMLAETARCATTYGLDSSPEFLVMARRRFPDCVFLEHDVTKAPFPVMADVMYARFLLCHLRDPLEAIDLWITQLNTGGLLFLEEIDSIDTDVDVFKTYLAVNQGIIAAEGASLYVGQAIAATKYRADVLLNAAAVLPVANHRAASWFVPNTQTIWQESDYVQERLSPEERENVSRELARLKEKQDSRRDITWRLRRLVLNRQAG